MILPTPAPTSRTEFPAPSGFTPSRRLVVAPQAGCLPPGRAWRRFASLAGAPRSRAKADDPRDRRWCPPHGSRSAPWSSVPQRGVKSTRCYTTTFQQPSGRADRTSYRTENSRSRPGNSPRSLLPCSVCAREPRRSPLSWSSLSGEERELHQVLWRTLCAQCSQLTDRRRFVCLQPRGWRSKVVGLALCARTRLRPKRRQRALALEMNVPRRTEFDLQGQPL
jgi:hypothetical protein